MSISQLITATIGGTDVSNKIQKLIVTRKATEGIGSFTLDLWNQDLALSAFDAETAVAISLATSYGGTLHAFFNGYVDISDLINTQDRMQKNVATMQVKGRDYGQDMQNKTVWGSNQGAIETIISNLLTHGVSPYISGIPSGYTEIAYNPTGPFPSGDYVFWDSQGRTLISDNIRRLLSLKNWDGYVDLSKNWVMFPVGSVSSGINLYDLPNDSRNNIIGPIHVKPIDGMELRNVIIAYGGQVNDSWTDWGMAQYWTPESYPAGGGNAATHCTIADFAQSSDIWQLPIAGAAMLKVTNTTSGFSLNSVLWGLVFPSLFHWYLPFNQFSLDTLKWSMLSANPTEGTPEGQVPNSMTDYFLIEPAISLQDTIGNVITFIFGGYYQFNKWNTYQVPVGWNITTEGKIWSTVSGHGSLLLPGDSGYDKWVYTTWSSASGNVGFNWKVVNITFQSGLPNPPDVPLEKSDVRAITYMLFDDLVIPQIQICATADHSGYNNYGFGVGVCPICKRTFSASGYKQRHLPLTRSNIVYQTDLQTYAETVCNQRMTPLSTVNLRCDGRAGLVSGAWAWYPGKSLSLNGAENYRMIEIIHTITRNVDGSGFDHVVDLSLVPKTFQLDMEQWTYNQHGDIGIPRQLHDRVQALENTYQLINPTT